MIIPEREITIEHADTISGASLCRKELGNIKKVGAYTRVGLLARFITPEIVNAFSSNVGSLAQNFADNSQNENIQKYSDGMGYLAAEGTKVSLGAIKQLALNTDKMISLKGIIQLMRYCSEGQSDSFIQDTTVAEIIASLPIKNDTAYHIFSDKVIASPRDIMGIQYTYSELESIGFLLYFMVRARCSAEELKYKSRLLESLRFIEMENRMQDYEIQYRSSGQDKAVQIKEACCSFENMRRSNIRINGKYFSKVVKKLSYYMPADCEVQRRSLLVTSQGMDALINRDANLGINAVGQALALITDSCRKSKDNVEEECHKYLVQKEGIEGNVVSTEIMPASKEIGEYFDDLGEDHV